MIGHFLKRDFSDALVLWIILGLLSLALWGTYAWSPSESILMGLGWLYFLFPQFCTLNITGSIVRTDHMISRQYFLALPLRRTQFFFITLFRIMVLYLPLCFFLILVVPFCFVPQKLYTHPNWYLAWSIYVFGILMSVVWWISHHLFYSLIIEQSLRFSNSKKRILTTLFPILAFVLEIAVFFSCLAFTLLFILGYRPFPHPLLVYLMIPLCIAIPAGITLLTVRLAKARWTSVS
ncbi:hypothetical protein EBT16_13645 [bacterium]|nr:hypothetical protein [bacterium]